jgi:hypothetical protein
VGNHIDSKPHAFSNPVSLGRLCQAMFIEGARVLGYTREALMPKEIQEQIFLAATLIVDGLGQLLQNQDEAEQEVTCRGPAHQRPPIG